MNFGDHIVDRLSVPKEAFDRMVRAVPDEFVWAIVSDWVRPAAPAEPAKSLVEKLVEKFGPR